MSVLSVNNPHGSLAPTCPVGSLALFDIDLPGFRVGNLTGNGCMHEPPLRSDPKICWPER